MVSTRAMLRVLVSLLAGAALSTASQAGVVVVSGSGAALLNAVAFAAPGDILLVHGGTYDNFGLIGKSLAIVAYPGESVTVTGLSEINHAPPGSQLLLSGLRVTFLYITDCAAPLRMQEITTIGPPNGSLVSIGAGPDVVLAHCNLQGGLESPLDPGNTALSVSTAVLYDCALIGGPGGPGAGSVHNGFPGGRGLSTASGFVFASNTTFTGGAGGDGGPVGPLPPLCGSPGVGGAGLNNLSSPFVSPSQVFLLDCSAQGGPGGFDACTGLPGPSGPAINDPAAAVSILSGSHRELIGPRAVRAGDPLSFTFRGMPGDRVILVTSTETGWTYVPLFRGVVTYGAGSRRLPMGMVPGSGVLSVNLTAPALPSGVFGSLRMFQALFVDTNNQITLSGPVTTLFFDASL